VAVPGRNEYWWWGWKRGPTSADVKSQGEGSCVEKTLTRGGMTGKREGRGEDAEATERKRGRNSSTPNNELVKFSNDRESDITATQTKKRKKGE